MNSQQLEYVRQQLIVATADLSGTVKGKPVAFAESALFTATARRRRRKPMSCRQSRSKGSSIALIRQVEFGTASWRRAVLSLEDHQKAWLLWNYSENIRFEHQAAITQWAWAAFREQIGAKKVSGKTLERLKKLIWLAAQDVKAELAGRETYEYKALAELAGVTPKNWSETFTDRWVEMRRIFLRLDSGALLQVTRSRSQQKATNFDRSLAKLD